MKVMTIIVCALLAGCASPSWKCRNAMDVEGCKAYYTIENRRAAQQMQRALMIFAAGASAGLAEQERREQERAVNEAIRRGYQ